VTIEPQKTPSAAPPRDRLGNACFALHIAVLIYVLAGWLFPERGALTFYLLFLPGMLLHWRLNGNSCVLNNLESWLRTGRWRDPSSREEGQWLATLIKDVSGLQFTTAQMDLFTYGALALLWGTGLSHLILQ